MSELDKIKRHPDVYRVEELCEGCHWVRYQDGSALLVDSWGRTIPSPLQKHEIVQQVRTLGVLQGVRHFVFKACEWATRDRAEFGMFDKEGHEKVFCDPKLENLDSMERIQDEFNKLVIASRDRTNPRRKEPMLVDLSVNPGLGMRR